MRWLLRTSLALGALSALAVLAAGVVLWALGTTQGSAWLLGQVQARANGALAVGRVHGSLLRGVTLERVALRFGREAIDVDRVSIDWFVPAALAGTVALDVRAGRVDYRQQPGGDLEPESAEPIDLDLPVTIDVRTASAEAVGVTLGAETRELGPTRAAVRLEDGVLSIEDASTSTAGIAFTGDAALAFGAALGMTAEIDWAREAGEPRLAGRLAVSGTLPVLDVRHELTAPANVTAAGTVTLGSPPSAVLDVEWQELAWPGFDAVTSSGGTLALEGSVESYRFSGTAEALVAGTPARIELRGSGEAAALVLEQLRVASARGVIDASGEIGVDSRTATIALTATDLDPSLVHADWPGRLGGSAQVRAALEPLAVTVESFDVRGTLRELPLVATGGAAYAAPDRVQLAGVRVESGASWVALDGGLGLSGDAPLELTAGVRIRDLEDFVPRASGALEADLVLEGTRTVPRVTGSVSGADLTAFGYSVARARVTGEAGAGADDRVDVTLEANGLARGAIEVTSARVRLDGTGAEHRVSFDTGADRWHARAGASGGWSSGEWRGTLESLAVDEQSLGEWSLVEPAGLSFGRSSTVVETTCLAHGLGGRWCAELSLRGAADDRLLLVAQNFDLAALQPLLPPELTIRGVYQLSASFADLTREPRGSLAVSGGPTEVQAAFSERQTFGTVLEGLTVGATLEQGALELVASVRARDADGGLRLETRIADIRDENSAIAGRLDARWPDLSFLRLVTPDVGDIGGAVEADLRIAGTASEPQLQGGARWLDGRVAVPQWGLSIERISARADSNDGSALAFRASGFVDDAELTLTGSTEFDPRAGWPTRLELHGENVRAVQLPNAEVWVSPDLEATAQLPNVHVTGTVHVPRARIELSELPPAAIEPSPDAVVHGVEEEREFRTLRLTSDIRVTLGDAVQYLGLNLDTMVSGELRLRRDENRNTTATGSLALAGTYSAYGQTLELERGQLLFNGPLDNPAIDVRAVRTIEEVRAGVELQGTVQAPRTRVFSDPAMSEADALSYLLLGRPVTGTEGEETATLQSAALAMGLQQALPVVQRIGQSIGLDELTVQTTETDAGALMAGKYLSPRVFIRYSYGLFNRIGGLLLRFRVNERLSVETRSGDQKSMDLLYTVEKD